MAFGVLRSVFVTQELGLLAGLMAERGLRLRQGLDEALEGWDESGAEESDDDSDGGESEIEQREEECHTRLILIESECGLALLFLCPRQQRPVLCEDNRLLCFNYFHNSSLLCFSLQNSALLLFNSQLSLFYRKLCIAPPKTCPLSLLQALFFHMRNGQMQTLMVLS